MSSNSHQEELIYDQQDMDNVLDALSKSKREAELSHQLLWAVVQSAGGHIKVPYSIWAGEPDRELVMWDDPATYELNLRVQEIRQVQDV
jgi:hypothetical protein